MRKIGIANQKGGVGKTTTAINLSAGLALEGKRVLMIDLDPQGNATYGIGIDCEDTPTIKEVLVEDIPIQESIQRTYVEGLDVIPADITLSSAERQIASSPGSDFKLRTRLNNLKGYDFIIIDCAPTLSTIAMNAFTASDELILPIALAPFALKGVEGFFETVDFVNKEIGKHIGHKVKVLGALLTFFDLRTKVSKRMYKEVEEGLGDIVFETKIPNNVKLKESQESRKSIFDYDNKSKSAIAYEELVKEVVSRRKAYACT